MKSTQSGKSGKSFPANPSKSHLNNSKWAWPGLDATGYPVPKRFASFQALNTENWIPLGRTTTFQIQDTPPYFTLGRTNKSRKLRNYIFHHREFPYWPLKKDGWKTTFLFGNVNFSGAMLNAGGFISALQKLLRGRLRQRRGTLGGLRCDEFRKNSWSINTVFQVTSKVANEKNKTKQD